MSILYPVFIVGMPRSGTKLFRNVLNNNPHIFIPPNESKVIPYFLDKFSYEDLSESQLEEFFKKWEETTFVRRLKKKNIYLSKNEWFDKVNEKKIAKIIEKYFEILADKNGAKIWGEKTPHYLRHIKILNEYFPDAKFIHIIRDPRDYVLSVKKAWNKSLIRAAHRWNTFINDFNNQIPVLNKKQILEIKYEEFVSNPDVIISEVCKFVGIPYHDEMSKLTSTPENLGDTTGLKKIKKDNYGKWKERLSIKQRLKVEAICLSNLKRYGYEEIAYKGEGKKVNKYFLKILKIYDGMMLYYFELFKSTDESENIISMLRSYKKANFD